MSLWDEVRKIPPVTRSLCGSSVLVTGSVMLELVSPYTVIFMKDLVTKKLEIWRVFTSFFLGSTGIGYVFDLVMLYRTSNQMESTYYAGRSADYAWQLFLSCVAIVMLNIPIKSFAHSRPLLLALTYMTSRLAPPGTQTSMFGLFTFPVVYLPYALIVLDLITVGRASAVQSITGAIVGHVWWWGVWERRLLLNLGAAPRWLRKLLGDSGPPTVGGTGTEGVHVIPPRRMREEVQSAGHRWGSGNRLGSG